MDQKFNIQDEKVDPANKAKNAAKDLINLLKNNELDIAQIDEVLEVLGKRLLEYQKIIKQVNVSLCTQAKELSELILKELINLLRLEAIGIQRKIVDLIKKLLSSYLQEYSEKLNTSESKLHFMLGESESPTEELVQKIFSEFTLLYQDLRTKEIRDLILELGNSLIVKYNSSDDDRVIKFILNNFYKNIFNNFSDEVLQSHLEFITEKIVVSSLEDEVNLEAPLSIFIHKRLYSSQVLSRYLEECLQSSVKKSQATLLSNYFLYLSQLGLGRIYQQRYIGSQTTILNRTWFSLGVSVLNHHHIEIMRNDEQLYYELEKIENTKNTNLLPPNKLIGQNNLTEDLENYHTLIQKINITEFNDKAKEYYIERSIKDFIDIKKLTIFLPVIWKTMSKFIDRQDLFEIYNKVSLTPYDPNYLAGSSTGLPPKILPTYFDDHPSRKDYLEFMVFYPHLENLEDEYVEFVIFTLALLLKIDNENARKLPEFDFKDIHSARLAKDIKENKIPSFSAKIQLFQKMLNYPRYIKYGNNILETFNKLHISTAAASDAITEVNELLSGVQSIFEKSKTKIEEKYLELIYGSPFSKTKIESHVKKIIENIQKGYQSLSLVKFFHEIHNLDSIKTDNITLEIEGNLRTEDYTESDLAKISIEFVNINGQEQINLCEASKEYHKKLNEYILNMINPFCDEISSEEISRHELENNLVLSPIKKLNYENEVFSLINQLPTDSQNQEYIWFLDKEKIKRIEIKAIPEPDSLQFSIGQDDAKVEYDIISFNYKRDEQNYKSTKLRINANILIVKKLDTPQSLGFKVKRQEYLNLESSIRLIIELLTHFNHKIIDLMGS